MIDLMKVSQTQWYVTVRGASSSFTTIELAAQHLVEEYDIPDDEIDEAIIEMAIKRHNQATFSAKGKLIGTEDLYAKRK